MTLENVSKIDFYEELVSTRESPKLIVKTYHNLLHLLRHASIAITIIITSSEHILHARYAQALL